MDKAVERKPAALVSIVIPCYNSGEFLPDALQSVLASPRAAACEVIIVDDGSTDPPTLVLLQDLAGRGYQVIRQPNQGPAAARNTGIRASRGEYILFLDSDNKIRPAYVERGVAILDARPEVGVVHGDAAFFGDTTEPRFYGKPFSPYDIFQINYIDMCALIRKRAWQDVGGLDETRVLIGHEDWDFWIRVGAAGWQFHYLNEVLFDYRVRHDSLLKQATQADKFQKMLDYIYAKNIPVLLKSTAYLYQEHQYYQYDQQHPFRSFFKYLYRKYLKK